MRGNWGGGEKEERKKKLFDNTSESVLSLNRHRQIDHATNFHNVFPVTNLNTTTTN
jgi:hypothetical protein